jgi:chorismate mutase
MSTPILTGDTAPSADVARPAHGDSIDLLRKQIDAMDEAIVRLVGERARLSARVQRARMNAGGTRVQLGRERVVVDSYRSALGEDGPAVAEALLRLCRGAR